MTAPTSSALNPSDVAKLKSYLINSISREIEARPPAPRQRREAIQQFLQQGYETTKLNLSDSTA